MTRFFLIIITSLFISVSANGQLVNDSTVLKKYLNDTLGFVSFPNAILLDSIEPDNGFKKWELNTATSLTTFHNFFRYPKPNGNLSDTIVLSKCLRGFGTFCPPRGCAWYISAQKRKRIITVQDLNGLSNFLGTLDNKFDAYLWLTSHDLFDSRSVPIVTSSSTTYKIVDGGFLITLNMRIRDCPVTNGIVIYFVGLNKKIVRIRTKVIVISEGCI